MVVVLCHGFGAPGDDLVPIGQELAREVPSVGQSVRFVFPQAPLSLDASGWGDARAWWMIDMIKLQLAQQTGQMRDLRTEKPAGMAEARDRTSEALGSCPYLPDRISFMADFNQAERRGASGVPMWALASRRMCLACEGRPT